MILPGGGARNQVYFSQFMCKGYRRGANAIYSAFIRAVCEKRHFTSDGWRLVSPRRGSEEGKQSERKGKRRQKKKRESERE
jgi:hypothetical protein